MGTPLLDFQKPYAYQIICHPLEGGRPLLADRRPLLWCRMDAAPHGNSVGKATHLGINIPGPHMTKASFLILVKKNVF